MKGWMEGVSSAIFSPDASLTRAQAATVIVKIAGLMPGKADQPLLTASDIGPRLILIRRKNMGLYRAQAETISSRIGRLHAQKWS
jgi:hypothetical protein